MSLLHPQLMCIMDIIHHICKTTW